jgi:hypothetical protein
VTSCEPGRGLVGIDDFMLVLCRHAWRDRSAQFEPLRWLAGEFSDELEVLVGMEDGETCEFRCCCDQQVRYCGGSVYSAFDESELQIDRAE